MNSNFDNSVQGEKMVGFLFCLGIGLLVIFNPFDKTPVSILLSLLIIAVSLIPYFVWRNRKDRNLVVLGVFYYGFFHMVGYGLTGFISHSLAPSSIQENISDASEILAKILVVSHLLIVFFVWYVLQRLFNSSKPSNTTSDKKPSLTAYYTILLLCILLTLIEYFRILGIPPFDMITGIVIGIIRFLAYMYLFYFVFYLNIGGWFIKILSVIGCLMSQGALITISQIGPYAGVGLILILLSLQKGWLPVRIVLPIFFAFIILQPIKSAIRDSFDAKGYGIVESLSYGLKELEDLDNRLLIDIATQRVDYTLLLSSFVQHIGVRDETDYLGWKGYNNLKYVLIPRIFWEDKPDDFFSNEWAVQEGYLNRGDYVTSYNLPWLPQMYLSFGTVGIIIGSFIVGLILFLFERYYWTIKPDAWSFAVGYSVLRPMLTLEADFAMVLGIVIKVIMIDIIVRVVRRLLLALGQDASNSDSSDRSNYSLASGES